MTSAFDFDDLVRQAKDAGASDIHLQSSVIPYFRIHGDIIAAGDVPITEEQLNSVIDQVCDPASQEYLNTGKAGAIDRSYSIADVCRLRVSAAHCLEGRKIVARLIPSDVPDIDDFGMPSVFKSIAMEQTGFVLVGGATGSGKSTTIAAMIEHANRFTKRHVVTVEDPIEFVHQPKKCVFTRREVNHHLDRFDNGLRNALRQDPDIILVGEMRDRETMRAAIQAAETGHLVFATVHAAEVDDMPERVVGSFPEMEQDQIRSQLANVGLAFIAQTLVKKKEGDGRIGAYEILLMNNAARNLIRQDKCFNLTSVMQTSASSGMITMTQYLIDLYQKGLIDEQALVQSSSNKERAREVIMKTAGIDPSEASFFGRK